MVKPIWTSLQWAPQTKQVSLDQSKTLGMKVESQEGHLGVPPLQFRQDYAVQRLALTQVEASDNRLPFAELLDLNPRTEEFLVGE